MADEYGGLLAQAQPEVKISFVRVKQDHIIFKDMIDRDFKSKAIPQNIIKHRNLAIKLVTF